MEDIPLVKVDGNEGFKLPPFNLGEVLGCYVDKRVQDVQKALVSLGHDLSISAGIGQGYLGIPRPDELYP